MVTHRIDIVILKKSGVRNMEILIIFNTILLFSYKMLYNIGHN